MSHVEEELSTDGRARRWDSHREARRLELTLAARKAIHHGGAELSMDEIAAAIGTSKSIVYRYFGDRSGLQGAISEAVLEDLGDALAQAAHGKPSAQAALRAMVEAYLEMASSSPAVYVFVTRGAATESGATPSPLGSLADRAAALLLPALSEVLRRSGRDEALASVWAAGTIGFVRGAADLWLRSSGALGGVAAGPLPHVTGFTELADAITDWICFGTLPPTR